MNNYWDQFLHIVNTIKADFSPDSKRGPVQQRFTQGIQLMKEQRTFCRLLISKLAQLVQTETRRRVSLGWLGILALLVTGTAVVLIAVSSPATANFDLPPRDTPDTEVSTSASFGTAVGVRIHLQGEFVESWPWDDLHWQEDLWHEVEWLDEDNQWVKVDGWYGHFDTIFPEETRMVAQRELWATNTHLGTGPFRWKAYYGENGRLLHTSDSFYLPTESGDVVTVRLELWPR